MSLLLPLYILTPSKSCSIPSLSGMPSFTPNSVCHQCNSQVQATQIIHDLPLNMPAPMYCCSFPQLLCSFRPRSVQAPLLLPLTICMTSSTSRSSVKIPVWLASLKAFRIAVFPRLQPALHQSAQLRLTGHIHES